MAPEAMRNTSEYPICPAAPVTATRSGGVVIVSFPICAGVCWYERNQASMEASPPVRHPNRGRAMDAVKQATKGKVRLLPEMAIGLEAGAYRGVRGVRQRLTRSKPHTEPAPSGPF